MDRGGQAKCCHDGTGICGDHVERGIAFDGGYEIDRKGGRSGGKRDGDGIVEPRIAVDGDGAPSVHV